MEGKELIRYRHKRREKDEFGERQGFLGDLLPRSVGKFLREKGMIAGIKGVGL